MSRSTGAVTVDEFARLPDDDVKYELVSGVVHRMSPVGGLHGVIVTRLIAALNAWADQHHAGAVMMETGFVLATGPDTVRAPDVSFVRQERIEASGLPTGFWRGAPDLAVEVLSADDRPRDVAFKVRDYLTHGVALVWVLDPPSRTIAVHSVGTPFTLEGHQLLEGGHVLPGFQVPVSRLFPNDV
jgi:Uma2 family endonuclease